MLNLKFTRFLKTKSNAKFLCRKSKATLPPSSLRTKLAVEVSQCTTSQKRTKTSENCTKKRRARLFIKTKFNYIKRMKLNLSII